MASDYCTGGLIPHDYGCTTAKRPTRDSCTQDELKIKDINIKQLDRGYVVTVGCKAIALSSYEEVLFGLRQYFKDPYKTQDLFEKGELKFEK